LRGESCLNCCSCLETAPTLCPSMVVFLVTVTYNKYVLYYEALRKV
jgi:hypothetical protein